MTTVVTGLYLHLQSPHTGGYSEGSFGPGVGMPKGFETRVQDIASAAWLRGVVLTHADQVVDTLEARDLCRTIRAAHAATAGSARRRDHVEQLTFAIATGLGAEGPVRVHRRALNFLRGYARPTEAGSRRQ